MRVWSEGQGGTPVSDWEDRKVLKNFEVFLQLSVHIVEEQKV